MGFSLNSSYSPCGDQPEAIKALVEGIRTGKSAQVLKGVTGSGKTFTIANVIEQTGLPTLILAHNKTLAAQLYLEFKEFFPTNAVEYFVSYYDYYQPEAYIARSDTYIEKSLLINDEIDKLRLSATRSLLSRKDTIIVASVSCIYGIGSPEHYLAMSLSLKVGERYPRDFLLSRLAEMHYQATENVPDRGLFRETGSIIDIVPAYDTLFSLRLEFFDDELEAINLLHPTNFSLIKTLEEFTLFPGSHYVTPEEVREKALRSIATELEDRLCFFEDRPVERERLFNRTKYDMEMIKEIGFCKGIENYSAHFTNAPAGAPPYCLLDYFPKDFLLIVDESHRTLPQIRAMYHGDRSRKQSLIEFGFRLPSAYDNRPLTFDEAYRYFRKVIYVSATPGEEEIEKSLGNIVEQIIRPTGIPDPEIEVRSASGQIDDLLEEIRSRLEANPNEKIIVVSLTKKLAEDISSYLSNLNIRAAYLHSGIETAERSEILANLRKGYIDVLIGVNLLREGIDLPEVSLIAILDADKEGFLRSFSSLMQFCGRAARNISGKAILYADIITDSISQTLAETQRRRKLQQSYNKKHGIIPKPIIKEISSSLLPKKESTKNRELEEDISNFSEHEIEKFIKKYEKKMKEAAQKFLFEEAAYYRDLIQKYKEFLLYKQR
ncbi:excinuclease ABC subunit UvrB [Chlamydiifrater phoenicopteri]|uniref:excinuclease ABC subunit UvrB n=1 Tax=Chlamydiifrater phoenicopteri TaxID=2681469 RepID=UPI001BCCFDB0|nr:excinuclease ABC subunit UvrB [Chlamydiifrater phoenicopteri]